MTIAEQIAHDFLDSVEKNIVANKLDIKSLETNISYSSKDEVKMEVAVGDKVIYSKYSGTEVKMDGTEYIIVKQNDILAVVK